jgi:hypothetical protein
MGSKHHHINLKDPDAVLTRMAIVLTWIGGILLILKLLAEVVSRIWGGGHVNTNPLESSLEGYRLIIYFGLMFGGFLIYGRLGKLGKLVAEAVWVVVLLHIVLWFLAQDNFFSGWRLLDTILFSFIFLAVFSIFVYLLYKLVGGGKPASHAHDGTYKQVGPRI